MYPYIYIHISISYYSDGSCDTVREYTLKATNLCLDLTKYGSSEGASEFRTCIAIGNEDIHLCICIRIAIFITGLQ